MLIYVIVATCPNGYFGDYMVTYNYNEVYAQQALDDLRADARRIFKALQWDWYQVAKAEREQERNIESYYECERRVFELHDAFNHKATALVKQTALDRNLRTTRMWPTCYVMKALTLWGEPSKQELLKLQLREKHGAWM